MRRRAAVVAAALAAVLASGACTMGPDYRRPEVDTPEAYRVEARAPAELVDTAWWQQFGDPVLTDLVQAAMAENRDVRAAAARVEEFLGRYGVTRSQIFPQAAVQAQAARQRVSPSAAGLPAGTPSTFESYALDLGVAWEIDLWGRLRRATEAARAELLASEQARLAVILSLVAAVAASYVTLVDLDRQLEIARSTAQSRGESYRIFRLRFEGGTVSEVELNQALSDYELAQATIPLLEKQIAQQENALSVLLGRYPGPVVRGRPLDGLASPAVPEGLPSELLERRPDLLQAEQALVAANARIGVAKAAFFPSISLTAFLGTASSSLSDLFSGPARTWSYGGVLTQPIFTAGSLSGQLAVAEAQNRQALEQYQRAIQTAFQEVNDALVDQAKTREQLAAQRRQVEALRNYARHARLRYDNGYTSYLEVTDADTRLFNAELQYVQVQGQLLLALIDVYKAMGGGWVAQAAGGGKVQLPE